MPEPIFEAGPVDTPYVYTVSGTGTVTPRVCAALFDGTGASGDFLPAVVLKSQAGHVLARAADQGVKVTAGNSAEVSWFPGVNRSAAASAGGTAHWCEVVLGPSTPSGGVTSLNGGTHMPIVSLTTDDPANFVQINANAWSTPSTPMNVSVFFIASGGAKYTLGADVYVGALGQDNGGVNHPVAAFGANGTVHLVDWASYDITDTPTWNAYAAGGGVIQMVCHVTFLAVY